MKAPKTIISSIVALTFALSVAQAFEGNDDLYGSVLFDQAVEASHNHAIQPGIGDAYGSVLLDEKAGETGEPQRGENDEYGSILLDI